MISKMIYALKGALVYIKNHPQILFVLILLVLFPLLFLYTGQQFLDVGRANQDRLQKDRVGLMQDVYASLASATNFNAEILQNEFAKVAQLNPDIVDFTFSKSIGGQIVPVAAMDLEAIGSPITGEALEFYRNASLRRDESIIFETFEDKARTWHTYRAVVADDGNLYFIYTKISLKTIDALFVSREQSAYVSLIFIYCFILALAYWHIRLTDYRYLYITAQKANETKDLFTNMIAHELRAPLTAIRGYAAMIFEKTQNAEERKYASRVEESADRLITIVNDLLDVARIQSGKLKVEAEEVDVPLIIKAVTDELAVSAKEKSITLSYQFDGEPHIAWVDKKRLHQVLTNLVSNSIKYTPHGSIELSLEEKVAYIEVRVKDTGMGISSEDQKKLFAPFFRVQSTDVSKITGSGLGMWITKEIIELMGAKIGVESIKNVGTHVVVSLPKKNSL